MKLIWSDQKQDQFFIGHFDAGFICVLVELRLDLETLPRCGASDQVHHHLSTDKGTASPVGRDVTEHAMLDLVPLARSR